MNPFAVTKLAIGLVSSAGISKIVSDIVRSNVVVLTPIQKIAVNTGAFVVGAMVIEHSIKFIDDQINQIVTAVAESKEEDKGEETVKEEVLPETNPEA